MFSAFIKPFFQIIKKPQILLPALLLGIVSFLFTQQLMLSFVEIIYRTTVLGEVPKVALAELPFHLFGKYASNILSLAALGAIMAIIGALLSFFYTKYVKEGSASEAFSYSLGRFSEAVYFAVFAVAIIAIFLALVFVSSLIFSAGGIMEIIGAAIFAALIFVSAYAAIKLAFTLAIMAADELKLKKAVGKAWVWSNKRFLANALFLIMLAIAWDFVLIALTGFIAGIEDDIAAAALFVAFSSVAAAYAALAMADYYLS